MRLTSVIIVLVLVAAGCDNSSSPYSPTTPSEHDSKDIDEHADRVQSDQGDENAQQPKSIIAQAVKILNMIIVGEQTRDPERNSIDELATALGWSEIPGEQAIAGNAQKAYLALRTNAGGIIVGHQNTDEIFSIVVAQAFDHDGFFHEVEKTLLLEKMTTDYLPGQQTAYYLARERQSKIEVGVVALTTSSNPSISMHGTIGWISVKEWSRLNAE